MHFFEDFVPIPEKFWSFETGETFKHCSICGVDLMEEGTNYLIEKAFKKEEVLFEYAMCWDCRGKMMGELSMTSIKLIANYMDEHVDMEARLKNLMENQDLKVDPWISHCLVKKTSIEEAEEYHLCGHFVDEDLVFSGFPYALSDKTMEDLINLLSNETLGIMGDFSDKLFGIDLPQKIIII